MKGTLYIWPADYERASWGLDITSGLLAGAKIRGRLSRVNGKYIVLAEGVTGADDLKALVVRAFLAEHRVLQVDLSEPSEWHLPATTAVHPF